MNETIISFVILVILLLISLIESKENFETKPRIVNRGDQRRPVETLSAQTGEIVNYEDEREFNTEEGGGEEEEHIPHIPHLPHIPYGIDSFGLGSLGKRYGYSQGHNMFGDDFALFLVLLTIAGFFGLIISMLMPFMFIISNGGVIPLGIGGINGINGINGLNGLNGLGGLGGLGGVGGLGGLGGGLIGRRKRREEKELRNKMTEFLSLFDLSLDKYSD